MKRILVAFLIVMAVLSFKSTAFAQIPVELFAGKDKFTVDIMFFKFFKDTENENSKILFFNRNRASVDYRMSPGEYPPQFGFTEAISYNHPSMKGFAPVMVGQILSSGVYPKAGVQFARLTQDMTIFSWMVTETLKNPVLDYFLLVRYTPMITGEMNLFTQFECLNSLPTQDREYFSFIQRFRLGLKVKQWQAGAGFDLFQAGRKDFSKTSNLGIFFRHEF